MSGRGKRALPWVVAVALVGFVGWKLARSGFDWAAFGATLGAARWGDLVLGILVVWGIYFIRAARWAIFLRATAPPPGAVRVRWRQLIAPQFAGYAGLAIFGRLGELVRPWMVARRTGRTFPSQIGVVAVERIFDLGAFATVFSLDLLLAPGLDRMPFYGRFRMAAWGVAGLTAVLALVVVGIRVSGERMAGLARRVVRGRAGVWLEEKILSFRQGLNVIGGWGDFVGVVGLSLLLWGTNGVAYLAVMHAFPGTSGLGLAQMYVLMAFSIAGSVVQLPGVGGGSQVGTIGAMHLLLGVPEAQAVGSGLMLWLVTFMSVIPVGLACARSAGVRLGDARGEAGREATASRV